MTETPVEWLESLEQGGHVAYLRLLADCDWCLARAAYRVAIAKLATCPVVVPLVPTRIELHVAAREIARKSGATIATADTPMSEAARDAGVRVMHVPGPHALAEMARDAGLSVM